MEHYGLQFDDQEEHDDEESLELEDARIIDLILDAVKHNPAFARAIRQVVKV